MKPHDSALISLNPQVDSVAGLDEGVATPRPTTRVRWNAVLCSDEPQPAKLQPVAGPSIVRLRPDGAVFPFADCLPPQRVKVLPKVRGSRRGSAMLESPVGLQELLASNLTTDL